MSTVLIIKAHPHSNYDNQSVSLNVGNHFIKEYSNKNPKDEIIVRDLFEKDNIVPALNNATMQTIQDQRTGKSLSENEKNILADHIKWGNEFLRADKYVFINPMYNFFLPAEMKQYIDLVAVPKKAFKYTKKGPIGLLKNKKALHIQSSGSIYHQSDLEKFDLGSQYLKLALNVFGINDFYELYIEGVDQYKQHKKKIQEEAIQKLNKIIDNF